MRDLVSKGAAAGLGARRLARANSRPELRCNRPSRGARPRRRHRRPSAACAGLPSRAPALRRRQPPDRGAQAAARRRSPRNRCTRDRCPRIRLLESRGEQRRRCCPARENLPAERAEMARVDADLLDTMLNNAGRGEHLPRAARSAGQFHRLQPGGAGAHGHAAEGTAARPRDRDRGAGPEPSPGRETRTATISTRSSSTATPRCSSIRARSPRRRATSRASRACSRP